MMLDLPTKEVRELVEKHLRESDDTYYDIALRLGWYKNGQKKQGDATRLRRALGIDKDPGKYRTRMHRSTAQKIIEVIGADPVDVNGL